MKSEIYNLIILDESGSMSCVRRATVSGCNETLNTIRSASEQFGDKQEHFVSIFAFQSGGHMPSRYLIKNQPVEKVANINEELYKPWGGTPLYDALGGTLADLKAVTAGHKFAVGNVTVITDGMENSSEHYSLGKVAKMIDELKEMGWSFNFIGANIDVEATAKALNFDNAMEFEQDEDGTKEMFEHERKSRMAWASRACEAMENSASMSEEELRSKLKEASKDYFTY